MNNVKINGDIAFYEDGHLYVNVKDPKIKYTSVTTLIQDFHEKFDSDFWSGYKALEKLMGEDFKLLGVQAFLLDKKKLSLDIGDFVNEGDYLKLKQEIAEGYTRNGIEAAKYGTDLHAIKEAKFYTGGKINPKDCGFILHDGVFECEKNNFDLNREKAALPEYLVYYSSPDGLINLAGQVDLLIKDGNDLYIYDYKTNEKGIETKAYYDKTKKTTKKMFYPVNNLDDTKLNHYTIQLSLYAWMLQQINPKFQIKRLALIHIDRALIETEIVVEYKKKEVERLLKIFKKNQKLNTMRDV